MPSLPAPAQPSRREPNLTKAPILLSRGLLSSVFRGSAVATKFRYGSVARIPSPPLEERVRERRPFVSKFLCHNTRRRRSPVSHPRRLTGEERVGATRRAS